jgi:hypothetical protein
MTIKKQFAQDGVALDDRMEQLLEVLVQLLDENPTAATSELHLASTRATHVSVDNSKHQTELGSCQ